MGKTAYTSDLNLFKKLSFWVFVPFSIPSRKPQEQVQICLKKAVRKFLKDCKEKKSIKIGLEINFIIVGVGPILTILYLGNGNSH